MMRLDAERASVEEDFMDREMNSVNKIDEVAVDKADE